MNEILAHPAFGQADLTNCERELIHLAGSIQPHGLLLVLAEPDLRIVQCSANAAELLDAAGTPLVGSSIAELGGDLLPRLLDKLAALPAEESRPLRCRTEYAGKARDFEGVLHRAPDRVIVELEPIDPPQAGIAVAHRDAPDIQKLLAEAVERFGVAGSIGALSDAVVQVLRDLAGYDRVMVYKFDPDGHGEIIAEAREPALDSLLGHHYPATDIPQRARELYLRNRVRVLVDVNYAPVPVGPDAEALDMSLCYLRSMSPLHLQYLKNMGVTATLVISLVREGRLWGLIACHHYSPRHIRYACRAACELLAEVISTRITAIENYAHAQGVILVRALEQRLLEATSTDGDWKRALFLHPRTLLQPLGASGAALFFEGELLTTGEVPSTPELRQLAHWIASRDGDDTSFSTASIARDNPQLAGISPTASGVLAVELSSSRPDYLMWFRPEQVDTLTWAGDPNKAIVDNDPMNLSPRRSFAAWVQTVRGTASPWSRGDLALARSISAALIDIILQIQSVRLLIAQHQLNLVRVTVENSREPVIIAGADGRIVFVNEMFMRLCGTAGAPPATLAELPDAFSEPVKAQAMLRCLLDQRLPWRGELALRRPDGSGVPLGVRADLVPAANGGTLGTIIILTDLSDTKRVDAARARLEQALYVASRGELVSDGSTQVVQTPDEVVGAILTNARMAALDLADGAGDAAVASLIEELEAATTRATALYAQLRAYARDHR
jgi:PAS domain S-box-containing protein